MDQILAGASRCVSLWKCDFSDFDNNLVVWCQRIRETVDLELVLDLWPVGSRGYKEFVQNK